jgi:hypothetical protein
VIRITASIERQAVFWQRYGQTQPTYLKQERHYEHQDNRRYRSDWKIATGFCSGDGRSYPIHHSNSVGMPRWIRALWREKSAVLPAEVTRVPMCPGTLQRGVGAMSGSQSLSTTQAQPSGAVGDKNVSKRVTSHASSSPGAISIQGGETTRQRLQRLIAFMTKKHFAGLAVAAVGGLIWFLEPLGDDTALQNVLGEYGYWETAPPADFYLPGTINTIEVTSNGKIAIYPTCNIDPQTLAKVTLHSHTIDRTLAERLNKGFNLSGRIKDFLPVGVDAHKAKGVNLSLQNSILLQITEEELILVQRQIIKDACQEAIEISIKSGARVCQTRAALMGDLVYDMVYYDSGSARTNNTGPTVKVDTDGENSDRVVGKGLIYGVNFAQGGILYNTSDAKPADCQVSSKNKA